jgi:hypothetical protein
MINESLIEEELKRWISQRWMEKSAEGVLFEDFLTGIEKAWGIKGLWKEMLEK